MRQKLNVDARKRVSIRVTASSFSVSAALTNVVSQAKINKFERGVTLVKATTSVKSGAPVETSAAVKTNTPAKAGTPVRSGNLATNTGIVRSDTKRTASTSAKCTTPVKASNSAKSTTVVKLKLRLQQIPH